MRDDGTLTVEDLGPCPYCGGPVGKRAVLVGFHPTRGEVYRSQLCCKGECKKDLHITMDPDTRSVHIYTTPEVKL